MIFAVDGDGDCVYEREDEFLQWAVEQEFDELILYNIDHLLEYGGRVIMDYPDPDSTYKPVPFQGPNKGMNDNIMGEREEIEWHLSRFIYKAKTEYNLQVVAVVSGSEPKDSAFIENFYQFHVNSAARSEEGPVYEEFLDLFEDFTADFFNEYYYTYLDEPWNINYKTYGEDTLFLPRDDNDRISTIDKMIVDVYNLYVYQMRVSAGFVVSGGGGDPSTSGCNSLPSGSPCLKSFDAHLWEWEWWDHTKSNSGYDNGKQADLELELLGVFNSLIKNKIEKYISENPSVEVCEIADYVCFDRTEHPTWGNSIYTPQQRADTVDNMADRVYLYAYNSNPCDLYNSTQSSPGKVFHEKVELFANNSLGGDNNTTVIVPVFNAKYHSDIRWSEDRPVYYGDGNFGCDEIDPDSIPCDFCADYSGNALNSLVPHYPKQMGFVENIFQDQYDLNPAKTSAQNSDNTILGYSWFKSSLLQENDIISSVEVLKPHANANSIKIYPNPSSTGEFIIQSQKESITKVDVFTMTGQIVYSHKVNALQETLQMDTKGIYLVRVTTDDNKTETLKIVNQ